jgi:hypothetical protein
MHRPILDINWGRFTGGPKHRRNNLNPFLSDDAGWNSRKILAHTENAWIILWDDLLDFDMPALWNQISVVRGDSLNEVKTSAVRSVISVREFRTH